MRKNNKKAITTTMAVALVVALVVGLALGYLVSMLMAPAVPGVTTTVTAPGMVSTITSTATVVSTLEKTLTSVKTVTTGAPVVERLIIGVTDKVTDIDPSNAYDFFTWEVLSNTMEGLMRYVPGTTELEYGIARSHTIEKNGLVYIFKLKPGLRFADGTPATAEDVVRSIKRVMEIKGDPAWLVTDFVENVEALDSETVKFTLSTPVSYFLALLATPPYFPVHPAYKPKEIDSDQTAGGLGPYRIVKWTRDVELVLEANPYYYGGAPKIKQIIVRFFKDATSMRLELEAGRIDVAWRTLLPTDIKDLKTKPNLKTVECPGGFIRYIVINTRIKPFDNKLVRQALAAALNRKAICERVFLGLTEPLYSMIPIGMWSHIDAFKEKYGEHNIELAKNLLKQAGYSETNKLKIELWYTPTHYGDTEADVALLVKEAWEETGMIEVDIKSAEWTTYVDQSRKGIMGISLFGWYPDYIDPDDYTTAFVNASWLGYAYANAELSKILKEASVLPTVEERTPLYEKAQEIWAEDAAIIPMFQGKLVLVSKPNVEGIFLDPTMLLRYWLFFFSG